MSNRCNSSAGSIDRETSPASWRLLLPIVALVVLMSCLFLGQAFHIAGELGFPLDDAWIYARYADNLAHGHGFSFNPGVPSPGATSPLWAVLLAATYWFGASPVPAALVWGIGLLIASCWLTYRLALLIGAPRSAALLAAALTALMPRLVWGALSGMEVSLYVFMALLAIVWHLRYGLYSGWRSYLSTVAFALAALGRPECYVLFPIAWVDRVLTRKVKPHRLIPVFLSHLVLYCLILTPNWIFNLSITGSIFPATFHAKVLDGLWEALRLHDTQMLVESLSTRPISFVFQYIVFLLENNLVLFLPALCGVVVLVRRRRQSGSMMVPLVLILVPLAIGVFGRGHLSARYIANLIPLYAVSAVVGIRFLSKAIQDLPVPTRAPAIAMKAILILAFLR